MGEQHRIVGIDEAGRGALAGPVFAAAVILDVAKPISGLADSKALSADRRQILRHDIEEHALSWAVASSSRDEIESINILRATMLAMHRAVDAVCAQINDETQLLLKVDGNRFTPHRVQHQCVVGGDALVAEISAASILAKTHRDEYMASHVHKQFPEYGFNQHKGYGTVLHRKMILEHGPCNEHRSLFIRNVLRSTTTFV